MQFRDESKATAKLLKETKENKSITMGNAKRVERMDDQDIDAINNISESLNAASTHGLKVGSG